MARLICLIDSCDHNLSLSAGATCLVFSSGPLHPKCKNRLGSRNIPIRHRNTTAQRIPRTLPDGLNTSSVSGRRTPRWALVALGSRREGKLRLRMAADQGESMLPRLREPKGTNMMTSFSIPAVASSTTTASQSQHPPSTPSSSATAPFKLLPPPPQRTQGRRPQESFYLPNDRVPYFKEMLGAAGERSGDA